MQFNIDGRISLSFGHFLPRKIVVARTTCSDLDSETRIVKLDISTQAQCCNRQTHPGNKTTDIFRYFLLSSKWPQQSTINVAHDLCQTHAQRAQFAHSASLQKDIWWNRWCVILHGSRLKDRGSRKKDQASRKTPGVTDGGLSSCIDEDQDSRIKSPLFRTNS